MSSISTIEIVSRLRSLNVKLITPTTISNTFGIKNKNTIYKILERMEKYKLLDKLIKGKYILSDTSISDFEKAGIILSPSYISLESALSFYGILPQFTYSITSVTTLRSRKYIVKGKEFEYTKISHRYFSDYVKKDNFLIATPEKALIDLLYLASKKLRKPNLDEFDTSLINWKEFNKIKSKIDYLPFKNYLKENNLC